MSGHDGVVDEINRVRREVGARQAGAQGAGTVLLRRTYEAADAWDAVTSPGRIARWFLPVRGDFVVGGHCRSEGNADGEILECVPPELLRMSWLFGPEPGFGKVEVRLAPAGDGRTATAGRCSSWNTWPWCPRSSGHSSGRERSGSAGT